MLFDAFTFINQFLIGDIMRYSKYLALLSILLFNFVSLAQSEWKWVQPVPTGERLLEMTTVDQNTGIGLFTASVMKTTDAGKTWLSLLNTGASTNSAMSVLNANEIWCSGSSNVIYASGDGGKTWKNHTVKSISNIRKIQFFDSKNGILLGFRVTGEGVDMAVHYDLLKTKDGGKNWETVVKDLPFSVDTFSATDPNNMWAAEGNFYPDTGLWNSTDGGKKWKQVEQFQGTSVTQLSFKGNHGFVIAKHPIVGGKITETFISATTFDGGKNWDFNYNSYNYLAEKNGNVEAVSFIDDMNGWMSTFMIENDRTVGELRASNDGGKTWNTLSKSDNDIYGFIGFFDKNNGILARSTMMMSPVLQRTTDGGKTLTEITTGMNLNFYSFYFIDEQTGFANNDQGVVKTKDGGATWYRVKTPEKLNLSYFKFFDSKNGVAGGAFEDQYGSGYGNGAIFTTSDAGETWNPVADNNNPALTSLTFLSRLVAYGLKGDIETRTVVKSVDGGKTWSEIVTGKDKTENILAVFFVDENTGWVSGQKFVGDPEKPQLDSYFFRYTSDGGKTWTEQIRKQGYAQVQKIFFSDKKNGCIALAEGFTNVPLFYTTNDGGKKWTPSKFKDEVYIVNTLHFTDKNNGYLYFTLPCPDCGSFIYTTTDGGRNWSKKWELSAFGQHMFFLNPKTFWAGGSSSLMKYSGK